MAKIGLNELRSRAPTIDRARLDATSDEDIRRHKAEDGYADLEPPEAVRLVVPPKDLRVRLGRTQQEMADALRIPLGTWRNWEQDRVALDPAARSLLEIVDRLGETALGALGAATQDRPAPEAASTPPAGFPRPRRKIRMKHGD